MDLLGLAFFLGCDGHKDCEVSAQNMGYPSVTLYLLVGGLSNLVWWPMCNAILFPLMLRLNYLIASQVKVQCFWRLLLGSVGTAVIFFGMSGYQALMAA